MQQFKQPVFYQSDPSFYSLQYTYSFSKYSCIAWVYPLHIAFAYLIVITGFLALVSRVIDKLRPYHYTFGRWYLIFMFWCMATSLLIHNTGLPMPIIVSFLYLLVSITIGWNAIKLYMSRQTEKIRQRVNKRLNLLLGKALSARSQQSVDMKAIQDSQRSSLLAQTSLFDRIFSLKMLHGLFFTFSWSQMIGRTFVTNPATSFSGCFTYPAYKTAIPSTVYPVDSVSTPAFPMKQGVFIAMITAPTVIIILAVGLIVNYCYYRSDQKVKEVAAVQQSNLVIQ